MEKKNTMLLTIIAVATLLVAVVGATFAYFTAQNGASGSTTATVTTETIGAITVSNEDPALYLDLTAAQMQEGVTGSYWATKVKGAEPATNYASADKAVIAKLNVSGGGEETVYSCNFKITVDKTDVTLAYGDAAVVFALENNAEILGVTTGREIDYTTLLNEYTVNFTRVGDTEEDLPLVSVSMRVSNTEVEQGFAGETLTTTFTSSDLECEVIEEDSMRLTAPTITLNNNSLNIIPYDERAEEYEIYVNGELKTTIPAIAETNNEESNIATTKILKGTWQFNDELDAVAYDVYKVGRNTYDIEAFYKTHNAEIVPVVVGEFKLVGLGIGNTFGDIYVDAEATTFSEELPMSIEYEGTYFYTAFGLTKAAGQIFTFVDEQVVSDEFYEWFTANAREFPLQPIEYDMTSLNMTEGVYDITVKAVADAYLDSLESNNIEYAISILSGTWKLNSTMELPSEYEEEQIKYIVEYTTSRDNYTYEGFVITKNYLGQPHSGTNFLSTVNIADDGKSTGYTSMYCFSAKEFFNGHSGEETYTFDNQIVSQDFYNWFTANATKVS